jgi:perosamine synthetase
MKIINQIEPWIGEEEKRAIIDYLNSGGWLTEYKYTREFERVIAEYVGCKYVSVVTSGTASLAIAIMALNIKGSEIIVPDFTMIASANAVILAGSKPILIDINKKNLCLDLNLLKNAITPETKAIMLVSLNGRSPNMEEFVDFCNDNNLFLIEDAAQSLGSRYKGKQLGTFGDVGCLSFSFPKIITTGQGGAILTNNKEIYDEVLRIKDFGRPASGVDYHETLGFNFKFTDLQAVIGIEQMKKIEYRVKRKKEMFELYQQNLRDVNGISFIETNLDDVTPWYMDIVVEGNRDALASYLKERGIGTRPFYPAIHTQPPYIHVKGNYPNSEWAAQSGLWLPSSPFLTNDDIDYICKNIINYFKDKS